MESNTRSSSIPLIVGGIAVVLLCCAFVLIAGAGFILFRASRDLPTNVPFDIPTLLSPTKTDIPANPPPTLERPPAGSIPTETLETLKQTIVPENDPYELACRLRAICNVPRMVRGRSYQVGERETFWVLNSDTVQHRQIEATLKYITPHSYFWAEDGTRVNQDDVKRLMETFENKIYPTNREFFGSEWTPGVDGDPRIHVIYASGLGGNVAGYFNSTDSYNPLVREYSNARETFFISATQNLANEFTYTVLAHEFVHMIQYASDRNDSTWIDEGFADLGAFLNGYGVGGHDRLYTQNPDISLPDWPTQPGASAPHYGQAFLYLAYLLDRFGEDVTKAVIQHPENDLESIDLTLAELNITDPQTGNVVTADDVFVDWAVTMWLLDKSVGDGRFFYNIYPEAPRITVSESMSNCPASTSGTVNQYGIDYLTITCAGDYTLRFNGSTAVGLLPVDAYSGKYAFWSNKGNVSNMTLTREFDFTGVSAPIEISYWMWYDIEEDWDYLHLEASTDGQTWEILKTPSGTDYNPSGNSFGWGYTGQTGGWVRENVDLSQFAGQKVQIRFEYITDLAVIGEGFLLDDVRVEAVNYRSDFEADDGGWTAEGFVRVQNVLPQTFRLSLILKGDAATVTEITLDADQTAEIQLSLKPGEQAILVISGTTRFTRLPASYQVEVK
jgi:hypothetical protein